MNIFLRYKEMIQESSRFLNESFDKPFDKTEVHISKEELDHIHKNGNIEHYKEYELDDGRNEGKEKTLMTVYKRNGAYEIHHTIPGGISGEIVSTHKPNPRFVATMFHHAKSLIDDGHSVRIVGHKDNGMFDHYHRIGKALARKHGYVIGKVSSHTENSHSDVAHKYKTFNVSKLHESVIINNGFKLGPLYEIVISKTYIGQL